MLVQDKTQVTGICGSSPYYLQYVMSCKHLQSSSHLNYNMGKGLWAS